MTIQSPPPQNPRTGKFLKTLESAGRDAEACRMLERGHTYQEIADTLGFGNRGHAYRAVQQALAALPRESAMELRRVRTNQLNYLLYNAMQIIGGTYPVVSQSGQIVRDEDGQPLLDEAPRLAAIDKARRIVMDLAKIEGIIAPIRTEAVISIDSLDAQIAALTAELAVGAGAAEDAAAPGAEGREGPPGY